MTYEEVQEVSAFLAARPLGPLPPTATVSIQKMIYDINDRGWTISYMRQVGPTDWSVQLVRNTDREVSRVYSYPTLSFALWQAWTAVQRGEPVTWPVAVGYAMDALTVALRRATADVLNGPGTTLALDANGVVRLPHPSVTAMEARGQ